jgi:hypothetical protein
MSQFYSAYCTLIGSSSQVALCRQAQSLTELLCSIKQLWNVPELDDQQLLSVLATLNQQVLGGDVLLASCWMPFRYSAAARSIDWCLTDGHATEPFQSETISRYRSSVLLNQLIQPCTALTDLIHQKQAASKVQPTGFIFHLSRCGSTLVSGCLSELDSTCIFSESPVLTEILLDASLTSSEHKMHLQALIDLQARAFPERHAVIIKWNAWDIFHWELIRSIYPQVPVIFLIRNPLEILASHQRMAGWHMAGHTGLAAINSMCAPAISPEETLLDFRIRVLLSLLLAFEQYKLHGRVVDYTDINSELLQQISTDWGVSINLSSAKQINARLRLNSKMLNKEFVVDPTQNQHAFNKLDNEKIHQTLMPLYQQLRAIS